MKPFTRFTNNIVSDTTHRRINDRKRILRLVEKKEWSRLRDALATLYLYPAAIAEDGWRDPFGRNLLHIVCRHRPPLDVLHDVIRLGGPGLTEERDYLDRTPLHVAVECAASLGVVRCLLEENPSASAAKDHEGKTPLAYAVEQLSEPQGQSQWEIFQDLSTLYEAIRSLAVASPASITAEDNSGRTALETAVSVGAPPKILSDLKIIATCELGKIHVPGEKNGSLDDLIGQSSPTTNFRYRVEAGGYQQGESVGICALV